MRDIDLSIVPIHAISQNKGGRIMEPMDALLTGLSKLGPQELYEAVIVTSRKRRIDKIMQDIRDTERAILRDTEYEELVRRYRP